MVNALYKIRDRINMSAIPVRAGALGTIPQHKIDVQMMKHQHARSAVVCSRRPLNCTAQISSDESTPMSRRGSVALLLSSAILLGHTAATPTSASSASAAGSAGSAGDWSTPGLAAPVDDAAPKFFKTPSGVKVQELAIGNGAEVHKGDRVLVDYVLRRSNGYFIYGTIEGVSFQPQDVPTGAIALTLVRV